VSGIRAALGLLADAVVADRRSNARTIRQRASVRGKHFKPKRCSRCGSARREAGKGPLPFAPRPHPRYDHPAFALLRTDCAGRQYRSSSVASLSTPDRFASETVIAFSGILGPLSYCPWVETAESLALLSWPGIAVCWLHPRRPDGRRCCRRRAGLTEMRKRDQVSGGIFHGELGRTIKRFVYR
jgi:hypothetical protein